LEKIYDLIPDGSYEVYWSGDFNTRLGSPPDSAVDERQSIFFGADFPFHRIVPINETFTRIGRKQNYVEKSIIDHFFTNIHFTGIASVIVDERNRSDHHPLFLSIPLSQRLNFKSFERWNILKFKNPSYVDRYIDYITSNYTSTLSSLNNTLDLILNISSNQNDLKPLVNSAYDLVLNLINSAGNNSVGRFRYCYQSHKDFWTSSLRNAETRVLESQALYDHATSSSNRSYYFLVLKERKLLFDKLLAKRRNSMYENFIIKSEFHNHLSAIKLIKNLSSRENGGQSLLDPDKLPSYKDYFSSTFGKSPSGNLDLIDEDLLYMVDISWIEPTHQVPWNLNSIKNIILKMSSGKSGGSDNIPIEFMKIGIDKLVPLLDILFRIFYISNWIPDILRECLVAPIFKGKGLPQDISSYRPISLTSVIRKIYEHLILKELIPFSTSFLNSLQAGFLARRSTTEQIHLLSLIKSKYPDSITAFIDISAAYDTVNRDILFTYMAKHMGRDYYPLIRKLRSLFDYNSSKIVVNGHSSDSIDNLRGLLQGSPISPLLFDWYFNSLIESTIQLNPSINIGPLFINILAYADDAALVANSLDEIQLLVTHCENWCLDHGLLLAPHKSKVLCKLPQDQIISTSTHNLEYVESFKYLGVNFCCAGFDYKVHCKRIANLVNHHISWLSKKGLNKNGFLIKTGAVFFKLFITSRLEYGLCTMDIPQKWIKFLTLVYNRGLRAIASAPRATSIDALCIISNSLPFHLRLEELKGRYYFKLHQFRTSHPNIPLVQCLNYFLNYPQDRFKAKKFIAPFRENRFLVNLIENPNNLSYWKNIQASRLKLFSDKIIKCDPFNVAGALAGISWFEDPVYQNIRRPRILNVYAHRRKDQKLLTSWLLGNVANHISSCKKPNCRTNKDDFGRMHAVTCSGVHNMVLRNYPQLSESIESDYYRNSLDILISSFRTIKPTNRDFKFIISCVLKIIISCRVPQQPIDYG
jgi:hypothetical protein